MKLTTNPIHKIIVVLALVLPFGVQAALPDFTEIVEES